MSDLNTFFISGVVKQIVSNEKGFHTVTIEVIRETQKGTEQIQTPVTYWGDKASQINTGDYVISSGYIKSRIVPPTEKRGSFLATFLTGNTIRKIVGIQKPIEMPQQQQMNFDSSEVPF